MSALRIKLIGELYDCVKPLFEGQVHAAGIELAVTRSPSPEAMRRQLTGWEFDVCEMAFGAYLIARANGADVTAIPVFPRRAFFHTNFMCRADAPSDVRRDLAGKRIGVAEYVQSATVWARGVLEQDFGLDPRSVEWHVERAGSESTGEVLGFKPPADLVVRQTPAGKPIAAMLLAGELDLALLGGNLQPQVRAAARPLFADPVGEGRRFLAAHGFVPANHMYMIRGPLAREHPQAIAGLYRAFDAAHAHARQRLSRSGLPGLLVGSETMAQSCASIGGDPFSYGIESNRAMLQAVVRLCREQGLTRDEPTIDELFVSGLD